MWKPFSWRGLILTFEFFQCISNISFNNSHTRHPLCCMTSRTDLQNPCSPNSSTYQWRQKSTNEKYLQEQRESLEQERAEEKAFLIPWLLFRLIGRDQITGTENGCFSDLWCAQCHPWKWILKMDMLKIVIKERGSRQLTASWEGSKVYGKTYKSGLFRSVWPQFPSPYHSIPLIRLMCLSWHTIGVRDWLL